MTGSLGARGGKFALHRIGDKRQSHDLEATAKDRRRTRGDTALVLGCWASRRRSRSSFHALRLQPAVRLQAAESLWRLGSENGLQALVASSVSRFQTIMIALLGLRAARSAGAGASGRALTSDYDEVSLVAPEAQECSGPSRLRRGDEGAKALIRVSACLRRWHSELRRADAQNILATLLKDPDQDFGSLLLRRSYR